MPGLRTSNVVATVLSDFTVQVEADEIFLPCLGGKNEPEGRAGGISF